MRHFGALVAGAWVLSACGESVTSRPAASSPAATGTDERGDAFTAYDAVTGYNNYYEFSTDKEAVTDLARRGEVVVDALGAQALGGAPMQRDTIFRVASMVKPITAVAAMILVEECRLRLDDPVDAFLPELAHRRVLRSIASPLDDTVPAHRAITLRDLLTFRLGIGSVLAAPGTYPIQHAISERPADRRRRTAAAREDAPA